MVRILLVPAILFSYGGSCIPRDPFTGCRTESGEECIFPFIYKGKSYSGCTWEETTDERAWCATQLTDTGSVIPGKWGNCNSTLCSNTTSPSTSTIVTTNLQLQENVPGVYTTKAENISVVYPSNLPSTDYLPTEYSSTPLIQKNLPTEYYSTPLIQKNLPTEYSSTPLIQKNHPTEYSSTLLIQKNLPTEYSSTPLIQKDLDKEYSAVSDQMNLATKYSVNRLSQKDLATGYYNQALNQGNRPTEYSASPYVQVNHPTEYSASPYIQVNRPTEYSASPYIQVNPPSEYSASPYVQVNRPTEYPAIQFNQERPAINTPSIPLTQEKPTTTTLPITLFSTEQLGLSSASRQVPLNAPQGNRISSSHRKDDLGRNAYLEEDMSNYLPRQNNLYPKEDTGTYFAIKDQPTSLSTNDMSDIYPYQQLDTSGYGNSYPYQGVNMSGYGNSYPYQVVDMNNYVPSQGGEANYWQGQIKRLQEQGGQKYMRLRYPASTLPLAAIWQ